MSKLLRAALTSASAIACQIAAPSGVAAQQAQSGGQTDLPPVVVQQKKAPEATQPAAAKPKPKAAEKDVVVSKPAPKKAPPPPAQPTTPTATAAQPVVPHGYPDTGLRQVDNTALVGARSGSLTVPTAAEAQVEINRTPGGVAVVPASSYAASSPGATVKDAFDYVPGVLVRPSEGDLSNHFSIRGSGLSRNGDIRGVQFLMDGLIPLSRASGDTSFEDLDPSLFAYMEVYKGANALQYGANGLGGAVNFVSPTGYDSSLFGARYDFGSFGFSKWTATSGGVFGPADYFVALSGMEEAGYRHHSDGDYLRGIANVGYRFNRDAETRFYFSAAKTERASAGSLTKANALTDPTSAFISPGLGGTGVGNDNIDWNIRKITDSYQFANKTTIRVAPGTTVDFGGFFVERNTDLFAFNVISTAVDERGVFARLVDQHEIGGLKNRLVAGFKSHDGDQSRTQFVNNLGVAGTLRGSIEQQSRNRIFFAEDSLYVLPNVALVAGMQHVEADRKQGDNPNQAGNQSFDSTFTFWNPKAGLLWDVARYAQIFANVSWSGEAPTFSELPFAIPGPGPLSSNNKKVLEAQKAVTYEIGTRGDYGDYRWQLALYRSEIENEFQCITIVAATGFCSQVNIPKSIHQGVEVGGGAAIVKGLFEKGPSTDRIWLNLAYTFSDFRFVDNPIYGNNELPGQPKHVLKAELLYKHPSGIYVGPNIEWASGYYVDNFNTEAQRVDSYVLWGSKLGFDNGGKIAAYIEGRNLTNETYISSANVASFANAASTLYYPGNGRAVYGGIQYRW